MKQARGVLAEAERRAAVFWGADWCRFSVGGSTHGNQALALARRPAGRRGGRRPDAAPLDCCSGWCSRACGRCGCGPPSTPPSACPAPCRWPPSSTRSPSTPARGRVRRRPLVRRHHRRRPGLAAAAHAAGVPLVVDAGLGRPLRAAPRAAAARARRRRRRHGDQRAQDLAGRAQAARRAGPDRRGSTPAGSTGRSRPPHTTSPAGAILASMDAARALLARSGAELAEGLVGRVAAARERLRAVPGLRVLEGGCRRAVSTRPSSWCCCAGTGAHGVAVEEDLLAAGFPVELADRDTIVAVVTIADDDATVAAFADALAAAVERRRGRAPRRGRLGRRGRSGRAGADPRAAFFAPRRDRARRRPRSAGSAPSSSRRTRRACPCSHPASSITRRC